MEDIEITKIVEYLKEKVNGYICLGFDPKNPKMAIVVGKEGLFLENTYGERFPIDKPEDYEEAILKTIENSKKERKPLWTKYLKDFIDL